MDSTTLQTFSLRGMDERWITNPEDALVIEDMFYTSNDSWKTAGGYGQVFRPATFSYEDPRQRFDDTGAPADPTVVVQDTYAQILSMHWFAQHNGARQWLIYEEQNYEPLLVKNEEGAVTGDRGVQLSGTSTLKAFDGSIEKFSASVTGDAVVSDAQYFRVLREYKDPLMTEVGDSTDLEKVVPKIDDRTVNELSVRTQSQSYAGRLYIVNGSDEPLVFDGDICERAGFSKRPPAPSTNTSSWHMSTTFPFAVGDPTSGSRRIPDGTSGTVTRPPYTADIEDATARRSGPQSRGFYTCHANLPYFGLGSTSDAEIGAGKYRYSLSTSAKETQPFHPDFDNNVGMRFSYYALEQIDTRRCGFKYKVTYVNERGHESEASDSSGVAEIENGRGGKRRCNHGKGTIAVNLPIGPKECVARRIYRTRNLYDSNGDMYTTGSGQSYYFLTEIQDNMTKIYLDGNPDTSLGELLDLAPLGNFPHRTKYLAVFKNTMFAAGDELNEIYYSAPLFPESFPKNNVISIGDDDGGPITGIRATKNALVVFKNRGIYLVKGDPLSGFVAQTLNRDIGCIAPDSIAELPGLGLVFLSERSIYLLEGALENTGSITGVVNLGTEIPNQLERLNTSASIRACSAVYQKDKEYWLSVPIDGSRVNNYCLIYHYQVGSWSIRNGFPMGCCVVSKDHRSYLFFGSNRVGNLIDVSDPDYDPTRPEDTRPIPAAGIHVYSRGYSAKGDAFLTPRYETVANDYNSVFTTFRPVYMMPYCVGYGNNPLSINYRVNRSMDEVRGVSLQDAEQQDPSDPYPVYGTSMYDSTRWMAYRPIVIRYDISATSKAPVRELSVSFAALRDGNKIEIIGYDLEAKVGEQRNIKPLNKALKPSRR